MWQASEEKSIEFGGGEGAGGEGGGGGNGGERGGSGVHVEDWGEGGEERSEQVEVIISGLVIVICGIREERATTVLRSSFSYL